MADASLTQLDLTDALTHQTRELTEVFNSAVARLSMDSGNRTQEVMDQWEEWHNEDTDSVLSLLNQILTDVQSLVAGVSAS